ncbi:MAG: hypothetical protein KDA89_01145 [Planctomycetaceae bacterium]|nr:hypothetical protein [Planctomycetaceae bacterium]
MSNTSVRQLLIPTVALVTGAAIAVLGHSALQPNDPGLQKAVREFNHLEASQQEAVYTAAAGFITRDPNDQQRIRDIHQAALDDPRLLEKLKQLHGWWLSLDPTARQSLRDANGQFRGSWVQDVERQWTSPEQREEQFVVSFPSWSAWRSGERSETRYEFSLHQVEQLLAELIPDPIPEDLREKLQQFPQESQDIERTLAKAVWVARRIAPPGPGPTTGPPSEGTRTERVLQPEQIRRAIEDLLLDSPSRERLEATFTEFRFQDRIRTGPGQPPDSSRIPELAERFKAFAVSGVFMRGIVDHLSSLLRHRHSGDAGTDPVTVFAEELDRQRQLDLMRRDPDDVNRTLREEVFETINARSPALAELSRDARDARMALTLPGFSRGGVGDGRRGGQRNGFGPGRREDDRGSGPPPRGDGPPGEPRGDGPRDRNNFRDDGPRPSERPPREPDRRPPLSPDRFNDSPPR